MDIFHVVIPRNGLHGREVVVLPDNVYRVLETAYTAGRVSEGEGLAAGHLETAYTAGR